ncbi:MAG: type II toxin-antitoxin system RelE/ParE family toxin [Candidatus Diapherotrites archaeon]
MFELLLTEAFAREFKKLEKTERERIKKKLNATTKTPFLFYERLTGHDLFKLRVGKYRLIAQINMREKKITLLSVKHRAPAYQTH